MRFRGWFLVGAATSLGLLASASLKTPSGQGGAHNPSHGHLSATASSPLPGMTLSPEPVSPTMAFSSPSSGTSPSELQSPALRDVRLYDNYFSPSDLYILAGTSVLWKNHGEHHHTVTSANGLWDSGELGSGGEFGLTFTQAGTFRYYCRFHSRDMYGTVVVE
jgi:plastocyanin